MIDFATNYNYLGPPNGLQEVARDIVNPAIGSYTEHPATAIVEAIGKYFGVSTKNIASGNGASEIIYNLPAVLDKKRAISFNPTFWEYRLANARANIRYEEIPLTPEDDFAYDPNRLEAKLRLGSAVIYLCNPNNPTGSMIQKDDLLDLSKTNASSDFVIDETYLQFREDFENTTFSKEAAKSHNIHVIHSFSKFFTCPGLRSGALISNPETIATFKKLQIPYMASPLSHLLTPWLLNQNEFIETSRSELVTHRARVLDLLRSTVGDEITFSQPTANFILARAHLHTLDPADELAKRSLLVRPGSSWGRTMSNYFRFCIRDNSDMANLSQSLHDITKI